MQDALEHHLGDWRFFSRPQLAAGQGGLVGPFSSLPGAALSPEPVPSQRNLASKAVIVRLGVVTQ